MWVVKLLGQFPPLTVGSLALFHYWLDDVIIEKWQNPPARRASTKYRAVNLHEPARHATTRLMLKFLANDSRDPTHRNGPATTSRAPEDKIHGGPNWRS